MNTRRLTTVIVETVGTLRVPPKVIHIDLTTTQHLGCLQTDSDLAYDSCDLTIVKDKEEQITSQQQKKNF